MMALLMMGGIGMGMAMGYYGMNKLYEKLGGLHEEMQSLSMRASGISQSLVTIERRLDEAGGQVRDRMRHLQQRLWCLRGWVLMRWSEHPCPTSMRVSKMRNWLLIEYDAMRVGCHQDHEIMWAGICTLAYISTFSMMVSFMMCSDKEIPSHGFYSTMNDEGKNKGEILNEIKANIDAAMQCGLMVMAEPGMDQWDQLMRRDSPMRFQMRLMELMEEIHEMRSDERWPGIHNLVLAGLNHGDAMRSILQTAHMG